MRSKTRERALKRRQAMQKRNARKRELNRVIAELTAPPKFVTQSKTASFGFPSGMGFGQSLPRGSYNQSINTHMQSKSAGLMEADYAEAEVRLLAQYAALFPGLKDHFKFPAELPPWQMEAKEEESPLLQQVRLLGLGDQFTLSSSFLRNDMSNGSLSVSSVSPPKLSAFVTLFPIMATRSRRCPVSIACSIANLACSVRSKSMLWRATKARCSCRDTSSSAESCPRWK